MGAVVLLSETLAAVRQHAKQKTAADEIKKAVSQLSLIGREPTLSNLFVLLGSQPSEGRTCLKPRRTCFQPSDGGTGFQPRTSPPRHVLHIMTIILRTSICCPIPRFLSRWFCGLRANNQKQKLPPSIRRRLLPIANRIETCAANQDAAQQERTLECVTTGIAAFFIWLQIPPVVGHCSPGSKVCQRQGRPLTMIQPKPHPDKKKRARGNFSKQYRIGVRATSPSLGLVNGDNGLTAKGRTGKEIAGVAIGMAHAQVLQLRHHHGASGDKAASQDCMLSAKMPRATRRAEL